MGNKQVKKIDVTNYDHAEWSHAGIHRSIAEIVQSSRGRGQAEAQILHFDPKLDLQKQIEIYQYRKDQDNALVKCITVFVEQTKTKSLCGSKQVLRVLTERIPLRLNQLPQLTFEESLYALSEAFRGYKDCYNKLGPFEITDEMIGINNDGEVKVWVNEEFAQNHPSIERPMLVTSGRAHQQEERVQDLAVKTDQANMIKTIARLIEKKCESERFPVDFSERMNSNASNFDQTFKTIEAYATQKKLFIPDRIMNMNVVYPKGKYFTPGDQYVRDKNDPLYRQRKQMVSPQQKTPINNNSIQPLQNTPAINRVVSYQSSPPIILPHSITQQNGRVSSPILSLYQQQGPVNIQQGYVILQSPDSYSRVNGQNGNVGFNVISPQKSTLVFNSQSCVYPHEVLHYRQQQ